VIEVIATLTVHNRVDLTLRALDAYFRQVVAPDVRLDAILVDDGSTDGTAERVRAQFPLVEIIEGDGSLFWSKGMAAAQEVAIQRDPDLLVWLNDDVVLFPDALDRGLRELESRTRKAIVVGATQAPGGQVISGGLRRKRRRPTSQVRVYPSPVAQLLDTFNGNFVLVPRHAFKLLGTVDGHFAHSYGDIDYGLRARKLGVEAWLLPGTVGECRPNPLDASWRYSSHRRSKRLNLLISTKGWPVRDHIYFFRRHAPIGWPFLVAASYSKALFLIAIGR